MVSSWRPSARYSVHVYPNPIAHATRIVRTAQSVARITGCRVLILGIHDGQVPYQEAVSARVAVRRFPLAMGAETRNTLLRVLQTIEFSLHVLLYCRKLSLELVNVHTLSMLPVGVVLKYLKHAILVYDIHELETEKIHWRGLRRRLARFVEKRLIAEAQQVIVVSPSIAAWYEARYGVLCDVVLNAPAAHPPVAHQQVGDRPFPVPPRGGLTFIYLGSLSPGRSIPLLLEVFGALHRHSLVLVGDGEYGDLVRHAASCHPNIFYHGAVLPDAVRQFVAAADVGLALIESVCLSYCCALPTKFFEYLAAGIPVVVSGGVDMKRIVKKYGLGVVLEDSSADKVLACLDALDQHSVAEYRRSACAMARRFTWEAEEGRLERIYGILLRGPRRMRVPEA